MQNMHAEMLHLDSYECLCDNPLPLHPQKPSSVSLKYLATTLSTHTNSSMLAIHRMDEYVQCSMKIRRGDIVIA